MVVPIELDEPAQAAVDAARAADGDDRLLRRARGSPTATRRTASSPPSRQVGRLPGGARAAVLRAGERARIGTGVTGPGAALWVEAEPVDERAGHRARAASSPPSTSSWSSPSCSGATPGRSSTPSSSMTDPSTLADTAGYAPYLTNDQKRELLETPDVEQRLDAADRAGPSDHLAEIEVTEKISEDVRERHGEEPARVPAAPAARRDPQGARRGRAARAPTTTAPASRRPTCPTTSARPRCARSASSSGPATRARSPAGSAPGSTPCSSCPGAYAPRTTPTSPAAREVLDADHHGLDDVKDRIVEYLGGPRAAGPSAAWRSSAAAAPARCWLLAGPPGVGKTSLGESRRAGARPQVRPGRPRRRARRGRDPRPPAHLRRRAARAASSAPSRRPAR